MAKRGKAAVVKSSGENRQSAHPEPPGAVAEALDKKFRIYVYLLLAAVVAAYANHFNNGYHFDDFHTIVNNIYIKSLRNIPRFFTDATTFSSLPTNQSYRPLVSATLAVDYFLGGGYRFFFHVSTFLLFLVQGVVMYWLFAAIFNRIECRPANRYVALAAVAWYLLHPANAETINYIIARSDSLSTFLILLAFAAYRRWNHGKRRYLYLLPFILSCLAKPIGAIFAPLLLLYVYLFEEYGSPTKLRLWRSLKKTAPTFLVCLLVMTFIKHMDPPTWRAGGSSLLHYVITQPFVLLHYFTTFFAPLSLSADTDWAPLTSLLDPRFLIGTIFLIGLITIAVLTARRDRWRPVAFGILWFLITLLPTSLIPLAEVMNDHRLFLPYVGLTLGICWTGYLVLNAVSTRFQPGQGVFRIATALFLILLTAYAFGTHERNAVWHTEESLWRDVTIKSPRNGRGLMNYGLALMGKGDYADAERYFLKAMQYVPNYANLYVNMGILKAKTGKASVAEPFFQKAIHLNPGWPDGYYWYANFLKEQKRYNEAAQYAFIALRLVPAHLDTRKLLMAIYLERNQFTELKALAKETLRIAPGDPQVLNFLAAGEQGGVEKH